MELLNFIQNNQITTYDSLKNILEAEPFKLKIKEDSSFPDLFLIYINHDSNCDISLVRECNGIILDKKTLKIVCHTFEKCIDDDSKIDEKIDIDNLYVEYAFEGTLIRLFYYNDVWRISTKKCIDASKSKWLSNKNFMELFSECLNGLNIESNLNINNCYSFILTHPENKIFVNYTLPQLIHISSRDMTTLQEIDVNIGIYKQMREKVNIINSNEIISYYKNLQFLNYEGIILIDNKFNRQKIKTYIFMKARQLWGNTNNRFMHYLELRKNPQLLEEYLGFFDYDKNRFIEYEGHISELAKKILKIYLDKNIYKKISKVPYYFNKIIYKLHGDFLKDKVRTNYDKVMQALLELDAKKICFIINHLTKDLSKNLNEQIGANQNIDENYEYLMEE